LSRQTEAAFFVALIGEARPVQIVDATESSAQNAADRELATADIAIAAAAWWR
jgi:hypothetical protein